MEHRGFDLEDRLATLEKHEQRRTLSPVDRVAERGYFAEPSGGGLPVLESEEALVFASDNYLGLTDDQRVQDAARQAAATVGTGAGSSRPVTGDTMVHHDLERLLAETKSTDRSLTFSSGYAASIGAITALEPDVVFVDERTRASLIDGCRLTDCETVAYDHRDPSSLRSEMETRAEHVEVSTDGGPRTDAGAHESWLIATDSVFEADGSVAPLSELADVAGEFGAWLLVDESDATGLYADGGGIVQADGLEERVHVQVGTFSKALASQGGYVAGSDALIECLISEARPFLSSAGLAPPSAAAASEALHLARHTDLRERLWNNVAHLRDGLKTMGFDAPGDSQILPLAVEDRSDARLLVQGLRDRGVVASLLGHSVTSGDETRVRIAPMASHDEADIVTCLEAFRTVGEDVGLL
ncbi:aminotransferase class I/II-fold pyridoxal phosphate-dependent enzyme [Natrarchaeobius halalkaliphilus]|uniref:8-amino-7-oxononanoate synthase n=1 Tax=Natrarchaeobius halalkaliphilus TaxID=1679091 RepID=A0A3N6M4L1_9EURY|nr:aminotransferase class I/II-fold pyridoxal phosphate-dependent enzyme [Natrarchaeobius halalkaliphilus]RQG90171.1 aminotransferase class I/II-fold pyridoxal phosphate-dependent enzyme [Natrarchaeobius halalkaliphilus]